MNTNDHVIKILDLIRELKCATLAKANVAGLSEKHYYAVQRVVRINRELDGEDYRVLHASYPDLVEACEAIIQLRRLASDLVMI